LSLPLPLPPITLDPSTRWYLEQLVSALMLETSASTSSGLVPGLMMLWPSTSIPPGWLVCDNRLLNTGEFPALYAVLGNQWSVAGDPAGTFRLPDAQDRFLKIAAAVSASALGGTATVAIERENLPNAQLGVAISDHTHVFTGTPHDHAVVDPGHVHTVTDPGHAHTALVESLSAVQAGGAASSVTAGNTGTASTGISINTATTDVTLDSTSATGTIETTALSGLSESLGDAIPLVVDPAHFTANLIIKT